MILQQGYNGAPLACLAGHGGASQLTGTRTESGGDWHISESVRPPTLGNGVDWVLLLLMHHVCACVHTAVSCGLGNQRFCNM